MWANTDSPNPREAPRRAPVALIGEVKAPATAPVAIGIENNKQKTLWLWETLYFH